MLLVAIGVLPMVLALGCLILRCREAVFRWVTLGACVEAALAFVAMSRVIRAGRIDALFGHLALDALSGFHLCIVTGIFFLTSIYARDYFDHEQDDRKLTDATAWKFGGLWFSFLGSMVGVLTFNNAGLVWVALESTTLASTFLICLHSDRLSIEAAWKYLIICSAGIALGLLGTVFFYSAAVTAGAPREGALQWTELLARSGSMNPGFVKIGFVLILIGYGTKVGLAPMHTWLPDAHSQAPTPVSAMFSGVLLNCGLYCITRFLPIVSASTGDPAWAQRFLVGFGLVSMAVAAVFILIQHDVKRLLAYSSVEHMGIITVGLGLGPAGCFAAMYHTLNHSVCKVISFFCAGRVGQTYGTREMRSITGSLTACPVWGAGLFVSLLVLIGCAPGAIFLSEFLILRAGISSGHFWIGGAFLLAVAAVFCGALRHAVDMAFGDEARPAQPLRQKIHPAAAILVAGMVGWLIFTGVWIPSGLSMILERAAKVISGG